MFEHWMRGTMYKLEVPKVLKRGETIALISISGGRAGDEDMLYRYEVGKKRLEEIWGIHVIPTPNALAGSSFLYEHPEARAEDLMWAMQDKKIKGIICMMGGDDSYRVLPYIDLNVIKIIQRYLWDIQILLHGWQSLQKLVSELTMVLIY